MRVRAVLVLGCVAAAFGGCGDGGARSGPEPVLWPDPGGELPESAYLDAHAWLREVSSWSSEGCGPGQPVEARRMGDFGVGNGHVFALSGYACPLNTLHTMIGPTYQKDSGFFEDTWSVLEADVDPQRLAVRDGRVFRVRGTPILITCERSAALSLVSVTFAPAGLGPDDPRNRSIVRIVAVRNPTDEVVGDVQLVTRNADSVRDDRVRRLVALAPAGAAGADRLSLGDLAPGREVTAALAWVVTTGGQGEAETVSALRSSDIDELLRTTRDAWHAWLEDAARLASPDPRVDDYLTGVLVTAGVQQTHRGGAGVMSQYTEMWIRNMSGPARLYARLGKHDDLRAMLAYYHLAARIGGDIQNAVELDHDPAEDPPEPDWSSKGAFSGREEAESPSYLPLMVDWYTTASGDDTLVAEQLDMLLRALDGQVIDERGLLPFSGDETYRAAMSIAFGLDLKHDYKGCCPSANSSFLWVAAAEALAGWCEHLGRAEEARSLRDRAGLVRTAAEQTYYTEAGYYAPYFDPDRPGTAPPPFEDVAACPLWCGYSQPDDERALANLAYLVEHAGRGDGFVVSPLHPVYDGVMDLDVHQGVYTGMEPGYLLQNLAAADHPLAEAAFNAVALAASASGNSAEYQIYDDHSALQIIYDASGTLGDYTARFMSWEGCVVADAVVGYLTGFEPDAAAGAARLAPRLPNHWPRMRWHGLRVGRARFDLELEQKGDLLSVTITTGAPEGLGIHLALPLAEVTVEQVRIDGEVLDPALIETWSPFGRTRVLLPPLRAEAAAPLRVEVRTAPAGG